MNRTKIVLALVLAISVAALTQAVNLVGAQYATPPSIEIFSPISSPKIYQETSVPLSITVNILTGEPDITYVSYTLDSQATVTLSNLTREDNVAYWTSTKGVFEHGTAFHADASLNNLAEGKHTLKVNSHAADGDEMSKSVDFTVNHNYAPPQGTTGYTNNTTTPTATDSQSGMPIPTINTGSIPPPENINYILFIIIAVIAVTILSTVLYLRRKPQTGQAIG